MNWTREELAKRFGWVDAKLEPKVEGRGNNTAYKEQPCVANTKKQTKTPAHTTKKPSNEHKQKQKHTNQHIKQRRRSTTTGKLRKTDKQSNAHI